LRRLTGASRSQMPAQSLEATNPVSESFVTKIGRRTTAVHPLDWTDLVIYYANIMKGHYPPHVRALFREAAILQNVIKELKDKGSLATTARNIFHNTRMRRIYLPIFTIISSPWRPPKGCICTKDLENIGSQNLPSAISAWHRRAVVQVCPTFSL